MKFISRILLVVSALVMPNAILAVAAWFSSRPMISIIFGLLAVVGIVFTVIIISTFRSKTGGQNEVIISVRRFNSDFFSHIISYVPALLTFSLNSDVQLYTMLMFYAFYAFALSLSDVVVLNPVVVLLGWSFKSASIVAGQGTEEVVIVSKSTTSVAPGERSLICLSTFGLYLVGENG